MAATVVERYGSRTEALGDTASATRLFVIFGAADAAEAMAALAANVDSQTYAGLPRIRFELTEQANNETWFATCEYETFTPNTATEPDELPTPEPTMAFDTAGGTQNIRSDIARSIHMAPGKPEPANAEAINWDGETVNGVDIVAPVFNFEFTRYYLPEDFNANAVAALSGMVNDDTFQGFDAGSVLFLGATGRRKQINGIEGMWEVTYKFAHQPNVVRAVGAITGIAQPGWDYLEVKYSKEQDLGNNKILPVAEAAIVHRVYFQADFSSLGL